MVKLFLVKAALKVFEWVNCLLDFLFPFKRRKDEFPRGRLSWYFCRLNQKSDSREKEGRPMLYDLASEEAMKKWEKMIVSLDPLKITAKDDTFESLKLFLQDFQRKDNPYKCSATGRLVTEALCTSFFKARKQLVESISKNPQVLEVKISSPMIVIGLQRTGTSFLSQILSLDPDCRYFIKGELENPVPFPKEETYKTSDPRLKIPEFQYVIARAFDPNFPKMLTSFHNTPANLLDEEIFALCQVQNYMGNYMLAPTGETRKFFLENGNAACAYQYLRRLMQHSSYQYPPRSHWVLKTPQHLFFLDDLMNEFPDACLIFTHRHPAESLCSFYSFMVYTYNIYCPIDHDTSEQWAKDIYEMTFVQISKFMEFRKKNPDNPHFLDLNFKEITETPLETVEKIYLRFGKKLTKQHKDAIEQYLQAEVREGKIQTPKATLAQMHLTIEEVNDRFAEYIGTYLPGTQTRFV